MTLITNVFATVGLLTVAAMLVVGILVAADIAKSITDIRRNGK